ncbi:MAG: ribosome assembly factor SBDS [Candidatus Burarchaeum sp.]|nr:ribosome assembly factor SBDS [Candidatus Burarchaeum sp.]MDO8339539.1 ribosome assembly factor SBDS [Candidatus Burarchaeum sp.]
MTSLEKSVIAHLDMQGEHFELLVDADLAYMYKTGKKTDLANVLVVEEVFKDAKKSERHKSELLQKMFKTTDINEIAKQIIQRGELQLTTDQRRKMLEDKRKQIVAIIARECIDPRTGAPHPPARIEKAMEEARVHIDATKSAEAQLEEVMSSLRPLLPLKFEKLRIAVRIPAEFASKAFGSLKEFNMQQDEWQKDGSLIAVVEIPAGTQGDFYDRVNKLTAGKVETKVLKK